MNLVFLGSEDAIRSAFEAAGWMARRRVSALARFSVMRAGAELRALPDAPMRTLMIDGEVADMSWQRSLNDTAKRHHLRIWKTPASGGIVRYGFGRDPRYRYEDFVKARRRYSRHRAKDRSAAGKGRQRFADDRMRGHGPLRGSPRKRSGSTRESTARSYRPTGVWPS